MESDDVHDKLSSSPVYPEASPGISCFVLNIKGHNLEPKSHAVPLVDVTMATH